MTEITRAEKPARPESPHVVTRYYELLHEYARNFQNLAPIAERGNSGEATPSPELLCRDEAEVWNWSERRAEYRATDAERLAAFEVSARASIALIEARILSARELLAHSERYWVEIASYEAEVDEWRQACDAIDRAYYEAREEAWLEGRREKFNVGKRVYPYRARNSWVIIARNGKGAIIREERYDDKPARVREVADVLEVA